MQAEHQLQVGRYLVNRILGLHVNQIAFSVATECCSKNEGEEEETHDYDHKAETVEGNHRQLFPLFLQIKHFIRVVAEQVK